MPTPGRDQPLTVAPSPATNMLYYRLKGHEFLTVIEGVFGPRDAVHATQTRLPDIVVVEVGVPADVGCSLIKAFINAAPNVRVLAYSLSPELKAFAAAEAAGAKGFVVQGAPLRDVVASIEALAVLRLIPEPRSRR